MVLTEGTRREVLPVSRDGAEMLSLDNVIAGLGVALRPETPGSSVKLLYEGREVTLFHKKSLASVGGDLRLLSAPALYEDGRWLLPVDAVPRLLGPLLAQPAEWRPGSRVLLIGRAGVARVSVSTFVSGDVVRVVLESSEKVPFRVQQGEGRVTVAVLRDTIDTTFHQERLTGGIVDWVQYLGGRENVFVLTLGRRFGQLRAVEQENPPRLVLEVEASAGVPSRAGAGAPAASPAPRAAPPATADTRALRVVVIDPGHGGSDTGAKGPGGTLEKDVALLIARRLRAQLINSLGLQVFLTRDGDQELSLDQRTAIANNYKADLFISIHANASRATGARGSEVYFLAYQASDDESRKVALAEGALPEAAEAGLAGGGAPSDVALILWDMAQAEHLEESSALASRLQEELSEIDGTRGRGVKQAPFRVLVGAAMPATLVEVAFISNPEEEKQLVSEAWQGRVAAALARGVSRYETERARRLGLLGDGARPGS